MPDDGRRVAVGGVRGCGAERVEDPDGRWVARRQVLDRRPGVGVDERGGSTRLDAATDLESQRQGGGEIVAAAALLLAAFVAGATAAREEAAERRLDERHALKYIRDVLDQLLDQQAVVRP